MRIVRQLFVDERGADLVEYALLVGLLSLAAIAAVGGVGDQVKGLYTTLENKIASAF